MFIEFLKDEKHQDRTRGSRGRKRAWGGSLWTPALLPLVMVFLLWLGLLAQAEAETFVYIPLTGENAIKVIRISDNTVVATVGVGTTPTGVAVTPNGAFVYVANLDSDTVSVVRASDWSPVVLIPVKSPAKVAITPDGAFAYVTNYYGQSTVSVIRTSDNTVVATVPVEGIRTWGIAITPDGAFAYVTDLSNNTSVIRTADNSVVATVPGETRGVAITPDGAFAYVTNEARNTVSVIRTADNTVVATIPVGISPWGAAITPNGAFAYVTNDGNNKVSVIRLLDHTVVSTVSVGLNPRGVAITPDGGFAYVGNYGSGTVSVIRTADNTVVAMIPVGTGPYEVAIGPAPSSPICDIQISQASYVNGETVTAQVLRIANPTAAPLAVELKLWFDVPTIPPVSFVNIGANGDIVFPAGFEQNFGPLSLATVIEAFPRGTYGFNCRILHPVSGGLLVEDLNPFNIQ